MLQLQVSLRTSPIFCIYAILFSVCNADAGSSSLYRYKRQQYSYASYSPGQYAAALAPANYNYSSSGSTAGSPGCPTCATCTPPCTANPCFFSSLPYHCTLDQCTQAQKDSNDFSIFAPNVKIPKCFFNLKGFKIFSFNLCAKSTAQTKPDDTTKKVECYGGNAAYGACFSITAPGTPPNPANGYVLVPDITSSSTTCQNIPTSTTTVMLTCAIKATDASSNVVGISNQFTVTISTDCTP
ncbi:uncharacterized protein LOC129590209 [Paramacrobiotus metropolitanus]|uniref:uncharacterized protein LOC129590209 n=1 Tax=Paramacrobiotus metropolitanus TaxID=2943436 RepID=UPI0024457E8A|nr:uncharacterized protein LOC129590209 [Paramacrobiotus metropolitanus]XP_055341289.1 uncharacterized protein LOC129590209 [Paramacrobiotus metropolitanus]